MSSLQNSKVEELLKENQMQRLRIGFYKNKLRQANQKIARLKNLCARQPIPQKEEKDEEKFMGNYTLDTLFPKKDHKKPPELAQAQYKFLSAILKNCTREPNGRRYEGVELDICNATYSLCPSAYNLMASVLGLPSDDTLDAHFGADNKLLKNALTILDQTHILIEKWREQNNADAIIDVILACDACSFDRITKENHSYAFVFYVQPIDPSYKCFPVFVLPNKDGKARENVTNIRDELTSLLKESNINVIAYATDGDAGYNSYHEAVFYKWLPIYCRYGFNITMEMLKKEKLLFSISDFLHVLKRARAKLFVKPGITMSTLDTNYIFNAESLLRSKIVTGGNLFDGSDTGFMNDFYAVELFSLENLKALIENKMYNEALYFAPFCLWSAAFLYEGLSRKDRKTLLKLAFDILFSEFYDIWAMIYAKKSSKDSRKFYRNLHITQKQSTKSQGVLFSDEATMMRLLNTLLFSYYVLENYENVAMNRIGSHTLENFFGQVRRLCNGYDSFKELMHAIIRTINVKHTIKKYKIPFQVNKRLNAGGVKCYNISEEDAILSIENQSMSFFVLVNPPPFELSQRPISPEEICQNIDLLIKKRKNKEKEKFGKMEEFFSQQYTSNRESEQPTSEREEFNELIALGENIEQREEDLQNKDKQRKATLHI